MEQPVLVYDDDCGFCTWWAEFFRARSDLPIVGFSHVDPQLRDRLPEGYRNCSHLVTGDGVYSCGESIEQTFVRSSVGRPFAPLIRVLRQYEGYHRLREWGYRRIADNRSFWGRFVSLPTDDRRR